MAGGDFSALLQPTTVNGNTFPCAHPLRLPDLHGCQPGQHLPTLSGKTRSRLHWKIPCSKPLPRSYRCRPALTRTYNTTVTSKNPVSANLYEIKIDQNIGTKVKISGSYDYDTRPNEVLSSLGSLGNKPPPTSRPTTYGSRSITSSRPTS